MADMSLSISVSKLLAGDRMNVYFIKTDKFKTNSINIFLRDELKRETATLNALVPAVLRRGSQSLHSIKDISRHLESLYGASFDCGVVKKGENHIVQFYAEHVDDKFSGGQGVFEKMLGFLGEIISKPYKEGNSFKAEYVDQEKENLRRLIESRVNDKTSYAVDRCFEEMCKDERFGVYEYGNVEDLDKINASILFTHYEEMLHTLPVDIFVCGNMEEPDVIEKIRNNIHFTGEKVKKLGKPDIHKTVESVRNVTEKMDVNQGKLSLGFRTNVASDDPEYFALVVYSGILGGGVHSKLFQNVREKASLAYYIFSRLDRFKGLMLISSGIEADNYHKAVDIIMKQIEEMNKGNISDYEFNATIRSIETGIRSLTDSQLGIVDYYLSQSVAGTQIGFDEFIRKTQKVTKEQVVDAAKRVQLDTVYFLTNGNTK